MLCNLVFVEPSITDTVSEPLFVTYTLLSKGLTATPYGKSPTLIVPSTLLLVLLITDRLFESSSVAYIFFVTGFTATPTGYVSTVSPDWFEVVLS
jgi:hypothetical protein